MRILFLNQFFHPDTAATSQYLTDLTRSLSPADSIAVICGASNYSAPLQNRSPSGAGIAPHIEIIRIKNRHFGKRIRQRIASYATFLLGAFTQALRLRNIDTVVTLTTPPFIPLVGTLLKSLRGARHVIWEMDVYPDIATGIGFLSPFTFFIRITSHLSRFIHRRADSIIVLGECMRQRLLSQGVPAHKIHIAENWADGSEIEPLPFPDDDTLTILYSGNFGRAHDFDTIRDAIQGLRKDPRFQFVFAGGGRSRALLEEFCSGNSLTNVAFDPYCSRDQLETSLARGHIGLVTQHPGSLGCVVPSKTYGIMAAGRPVLYIGPSAATPAHIIERFDCGWHIEPGDTAGLIGLLYRLSYNREEIERCGARARAAFEANFDRHIGVERVARIIGASGGLQVDLALQLDEVRLLPKAMSVSQSASGSASPGSNPGVSGASTR